MYRDNFVVSLKCDGKILRELDDKVSLPFGSEYSILFKNLESRKAVVKVEIDGKDISDAKNRLVIYPNETVELDRFLSSNNKFKFIEKTKEISDHRGDRIDDGIVRVTYNFEKETTSEHIIVVDHCYPIIHYVTYPPYIVYNTCTANSTGGYVTYGVSTAEVCSNNTSVSACSQTISSASANAATCSCADNTLRGKNTASSNSVNVSAVLDEFKKDDSGITVKGSKSNQSFIEASNVDVEDKAHVICIKLSGYSSSTHKENEKPLFAQVKVQCPTCGRMVKTKNKFCPNCGTALS